MNGQKFSLSFSKKIEKKCLQRSALGSDRKGDVKERKEPQALVELDQHSLQRNDDVEEEEELVIPLLQAKRSAVLSRLAKLQKEDGDERENTEKEEKVETQEDSKSLTLEEKAERALLEESKRRLDEWTSRDAKKDITIPAAHTEDALAAPLVDIGKESSLDDYDEIGVESFGAAILRGMGWKKSEGVGGREKRVIEIIDPSSKTLGSSEGKQTSTHKKGEEDEEEEDLPIVKGSYVFLHSGRHRGTYGVVEVVDEDHVLLRASMGQGMIREVEGNLRIATHKEYKESSRVINKEMYDKFKEAEMRKKNEGRRRDEDSGSDGIRKTKRRDREQASSEEENDKMRERDAEKEGRERREKERQRDEMERKERSEKQRDRDKQRDETEGQERNEIQRNRERQRDEKEGRERSEKQRDRDKHRDETERKETNERKRDEDKARRHRDEERQRHGRREEHSKEDKSWNDKGRMKDTQGKRKQEEVMEDKKMKEKQQRTMAPPWVRENLRVRIINKKYKGGKYHKEKVVVMSVVTAECCECVAEGGRVLEGIDPAWLETVIPKQPPMVVMVVKGQYNGQKGRILQLHKDQEKASIQLLDDETTILKLHYDDVCEYVLR